MLTERPELDPERLAALLDGRLNQGEADEVRSALASSSDDTTAAYADAVAIVSELAGEKMARVQEGRAKPFRVWAWSTAFAAAAVILVTLTLRPKRDVGGTPAEAASLIAQTAMTQPGLDWSSTRGATEDISVASRAARAGALLLDLEVAVRRGDLAVARQRSSAVVRLMDQVTGGAVVVAPYRGFALADSATPPSAEERKVVAGEVLQLVGTEIATAAVYLEALRIADPSGETKTLDELVSRASRAVAALRTDTDPATRAAADSFKVATQNHARSRGRIQQTASVLLRQLSQ